MVQIRFSFAAICLTSLWLMIRKTEKKQQQFLFPLSSCVSDKLDTGSVIRLVFCSDCKETIRIHSYRCFFINYKSINKRFIIIMNSVQESEWFEQKEKNWFNQLLKKMFKIEFSFISGIVHEWCDVIWFFQKFFSGHSSNIIAETMEKMDPTLVDHTHTHTKTQNCPLSTWGGIVWFHFFALVRKNDSIESEQKKNWTKNRLQFDRQIGNHYPSLLMFAFSLLMTFFSSSLFSFFPLFDINARRKRNRKRKKIKRIKLTMKKKMCYPDLQWWTTTNWSAKTKVPLNIHSSIAHLHSTQSLTTLNIFLYNEQQQQQKKRENNSPKHREIYSSKWNTH